MKEFLELIWYAPAWKGAVIFCIACVMIASLFKK